MGAGLKSAPDCGNIGEALMTRGIDSDQRTPKAALNARVRTDSRERARITNMNIPTSMAPCGHLFAEISVLKFPAQLQVMCQMGVAECWMIGDWVISTD